MKTSIPTNTKNVLLFHGPADGKTYTIDGRVKTLIIPVPTPEGFAEVEYKNTGARTKLNVEIWSSQ